MTDNLERGSMRFELHLPVDAGRILDPMIGSGIYYCECGLTWRRDLGAVSLETVLESVKCACGRGLSGDGLTAGLRQLIADGLQRRQQAAAKQ